MKSQSLLASVKVVPPTLENAADWIPMSDQANALLLVQSESKHLSVFKYFT